jgi:multidrug efflux pump subunit AcrA (membrane-fusion protein)
VLLAQSTTTGSASSQKIASIKTDAPAQISVNLSEIDVIKVAIGDPVTVTLDAFPGKSYTGKVISIDTIGSTSSGVTTYPAVIALDTEAPEILPNMAVAASIITAVKENVLLIPTTAVQSQKNSSTAKVMKRGQVESVPVEVGDSNDNLIEIVSGLNEGDEVVANPAVSSAAQSSSGQTRSVFGGFGGTLRPR